MANKTPKSPNQRERRDRREEILKTATRLFSEKGYRGTSIASIAKEVGLTEPGLLHYFPTKVKLLQGVLEYREQEDVEKYLPLVEQKTPTFPSVMDTIEELVADNQQRPALIRLFTVLVAESIRPNHPSHEYFVDRYQLARKTYGEVFRQLQADGEIRADCDPEKIGTLMIAMLDGLQIQWLLDSDNVDMKESFNYFSELISQYLKPK